MQAFSSFFGSIQQQFSAQTPPPSTEKYAPEIMQVLGALKETENDQQVTILTSLLDGSNDEKLAAADWLDNNNHSNASITIFKPLAHQDGDIIAATRLGSMYAEGRVDVPKDEQQAIRYLKLANTPIAHEKLGLMYLAQKKDLDAIDHFKLANTPIAQEQLTNIGKMYYQTALVLWKFPTPNVELYLLANTVRSKFRIAYNLGVSEAKFAHALTFVVGFGTLERFGRDYKKAVKHFEKIVTPSQTISKQISSLANYELGKIYLEGEAYGFGESKKYLAKAASYFQTAIQQGGLDKASESKARKKCSLANYKLGDSYATGELLGLGKDPLKAADCYTAALQQGGLDEATAEQANIKLKKITEPQIANSSAQIAQKISSSNLNTLGQDEEGL